MTYNSNRYFRLWGYTGAHEFLLIRSPLTFFDVEGYSPETSFTIDIEFWGVSYMDIPTMFNSMNIIEVNKDLPDKYKQYINRLGYKIFELKTDNGVFYVVAAGFLVGTSHWLEEDRIKNPQLNYNETIAQSNK